MTAHRTYYEPRYWKALRQLTVALCVLTAARMSAGEALYGIAGAPILQIGMDFPVVLYRVDHEALQKVRTVATRRQNALVIKSYPEQGFVFVVSNGATAGWFLVDILDLADISRERSVDFDLCKGCGYDNARLIERNGRLIFYIKAGRYSRETDTLETQYVGFDIDSGQFVRDINRGDDSYAIHAGIQSGGVDGSDFVQGIYVRANARQPYVTTGATTFDLTWNLPSWYSKPESGRLTQIANNDHVRVLLSFAGDNTERLVFDKRTGQWTSVPVSVLPTEGAKLLQRWLVRQDSRPGYDPAQWQRTRPQDTNSAPFWSAEDDPNSIPFWSAEGRSNLHQATSTGRFQFYDTQTATLMEYDTSHPDSDILLIDEHDFVYFRVGDELRRANIEAGALTNERLLAKAPELLAVHWLFHASD